MGGSRVPDPELHELTFPHRILRYEYQNDSAGAGKWRGGYGACVWLQFNDATTTLSIQPGSCAEETAPFGLAGGRAAPPGKIKMRSASGEVIEVSEAGLYHPRQGDVAEFYSAGGGGCGDPYERPVDAVFDDVVAGLVSVENAARQYGVVIDPKTVTVDLEASQKMRQRRALVDV
jgi:N-methylhydantoinase B